MRWVQNSSIIRGTQCFYISTFIHSPGSINIRWVIYMRRLCGMSQSEVYTSTAAALRSSNIQGEAVLQPFEDIAEANIIGQFKKY